VKSGVTRTCGLWFSVGSNGVACGSGFAGRTASFNLLSDFLISPEPGSQPFYGKLLLEEVRRNAGSEGFWRARDVVGG
jgi:hypothetical protein